MENYLGTPESWETAVKILEQIVRDKGVDAQGGDGEAAFYGPKLDFMAHDSIGREWQVATIQLDFVQPMRFDLTCMNEKSEKEPIVMIHAAIMGSIDRFLSILIEHTGGVFPLWLSPVQVSVLPVSDKHGAYAQEIVDRLNAENMRAEISQDDNLGKRIMSAKVEKVPYVLVVGDAEVEAKTATLEGRAGKIGTLPIADIIAKLKEEIRIRA